MESAAIRTSAPEAVEFRFYDVGLSVTSSSPDLLDKLARDFLYFMHPADSMSLLSIDAHLAPPPWERIPVEFASQITPNAVIYDRGSVRFNDYQHEALAIYDFAREHGEVWSENPDLLYEIVYLLALSRVGEVHDLRRIHRVHALGIESANRGALILLPENGGKSTLCMEMIRRPQVRILSDDTPLISRGKLLAFPTRIGIRGAKSAGIDAKYLRTMRRRNREPKTLLDVRYFQDRVVAETTPDAIIMGARRNCDDSWIEPIPRRKAAPALMANLVFGLGLPQVVEFFLRGGASDALRKTSIIAYRVAAAASLLRRAKCYRLVLGRDASQAADAVLSVLQKPTSS
ncbi:MAG TPA: hypothetical protein VMT64_03470 [Candidatus Binataceae bacterium]|nr:hypothetical protein [Candidatus Binataceae bacterium]